MLEPASEQLRRLLMELRLCTPRDFRRCRSRVRRLAHDLPAFDSVWLDALVQARKLTPFQARVLESAEPQRVRVGPCVLVSRLGGGLSGNTYLARSLTGHQLRVLKLIECKRDALEETSFRLRKFVHHVAGLAHPSLVVPSTADTHGNQLVVISRYVHGFQLKELLIRRGRYPAPVVWEIGRQLLHGLGALQARGQVHGDIRLANVRLTSAGVAVLVDTGILPALAPELTPHSEMNPECYDGIAPELIGTGRPASAASDLYALGCLLWQLLAGRPPFPHGDPLAKLASHQTRAIPDVRQWAPDTPALLAQSILALTAREPERRPDSAFALQKYWGLPRGSGRRRIAAFLESFDVPAQQATPQQAASIAGPIAALLLVSIAISGFAVTFARPNVPLLQVVSAWPDRLRQEATRLTSGRIPFLQGGESGSSGSDAPGSGSKLDCENLPSPDEFGQIKLDTDGPYAATEINAKGPLVITGKEGTHPQILVSDRGLSIWATDVHLVNVHLRRANSTTAAESESPPMALLRVTAQTLNLRDCSFQTHAGDSSGSDAQETQIARPLAIAWEMVDSSDPTAGRFDAQNVTIAGRGAALAAKGPMRDIQFRNCLKLGPGELVNLFPDKDKRINLAIKLKAVTCRESGSVVRWQVPENEPHKNQVTVQVDDCIFELRKERAALFAFAGKSSDPAWLGRVQITGGSSVANHEVQTVAWHHLEDETWEALDSGLLKLEGLTAATIRFAGPMSRDPADSVTVEFDAPTASETPPGISAAKLRFPGALR